jgi:molecular chaperone HtpG
VSGPWTLPPQHQTFQVDLRGVVDLLSHHLYASPRVYVRELLQNAVDAITARRATDPEAPTRVRIETAGGRLRLRDTGIGLTEARVHELLATIGRSSKRDEFGFARHEFLGQFGIGLLSCFLVADEITVGDPGGQLADGPLDRLLRRPLPGRAGVGRGGEQGAEEPSIGTTVTLVPRRGSEHWLTGPTVTELARLYGDQLPITVQVDGVTTTSGTLPGPHPPASARSPGGSTHSRRSASPRSTSSSWPYPRRA